MLNLKIIFILLLIFDFDGCYSQTDLRKVTFEIYQSKNDPLPGVNIRVKGSEDIFETQTNFNGHAELYLTNLNVDIEFSFLGPYFKFKLIEKVDLVKINLSNKKAIFFTKNKITKKLKLKT
ncbi:MAG: hypothetical protein KGZ81_04035 [Flavobacteriales bacterium]|nr:hypothetical protein [Flavobacteriales bacterium]